MHVMLDKHKDYFNRLIELLRCLLFQLRVRVELVLVLNFEASGSNTIFKLLKSRVVMVTSVTRQETQAPECYYRKMILSCMSTVDFYT